MNKNNDIAVCKECDEPYHISKRQQHFNLHQKPINLVPQTRPNLLKKIDQAKIMIQDTTDASDISLRSILPDQIPRPQYQKRFIEAPNHASNAIPGSIKPIDTGKVKSVRDFMDLQSNIVGTELQQQQIEKLHIEKAVEIRATKKLINKKQLPNYQNSNSQMNRQSQQYLMAPRINGPNIIGSMQGSNSSVVEYKIGENQKKIVSKNNNLVFSQQQDGSKFNNLDKVNSRGKNLDYFNNNSRYSNNSNNNYDNNRVFLQPNFQVLPVYEAKQLKQSERSNKTKVDIGRRQTIRPQQFKPIQTKSNVQNRVKNNRNQGEQGIQDIYGNYGSAYKDKIPGTSALGSPKNKIPLHPHECPSCHGFYCQHCKSTIPPNFRPFWDQNQSPELVQFYKKRINDEIERRRKGGQAKCLQCQDH